MNDYATNKKTYSKDLEKLAEKVANSGFKELELRLTSVLEKQNIMHYPVYAGVIECFNLVREGYTRTGIFVLGRTIEYILTLYIEEMFQHRKRIGISKGEYDNYSDFFGFANKIRFLAGENCTLRKHGLPNITRSFSKKALIPMGRRSTIDHIREYGRNKGAHYATADEITIIENNLINWIEGGVTFIIDMQLEINQIA